MFTGISQNKISIHIINQIRDAILTGRLEPGDHLPSEKELIHQFGVSKHTLREALRALEAMGFLEIRKGAGGGPVVMEVGMDHAVESIANFLHFKNVSIHHLSEVRKIIEPYLARIAAGRITPDQIDRLNLLNKKCRGILDRRQSISGAREEIDFHVMLGEISGNPVLILILGFVNSLLADVKNQIKPGLDFCEQVLKAHEKILEAIRNGDAEKAASAMHEHIREVEEGLRMKKETAT